MPLAAVLIASLVGGCATQGPDHRSAGRVKPQGPVCEIASGHGTTFSPAAARAYARQSLQYQVADTASFLRAIGSSSIEVSRETMTCAPYALPFGVTGMQRCVASAQVCGN